MTIKEQLVAIAREIKDEERHQGEKLATTTDAELLALAGVPLTSCVVLAAEHWMIVQEIMRRADLSGFQVPDDLFADFPRVGSEKC